MNDHEQQAALRGELADGENIIWHGQPSVREMAKSGRSVFIIGIGLLIFSMFYMSFPYLIKNDSDDDILIYLFLIFTIPIFIISLRMIAAPWIEKGKARRTVYAVTNHRAIILATGKKKKIASYYPDDITALNRKINDDGSGNLHFTLNPKRPAINAGTGLKNAFLGIQEVRVVELYLRDFLRIAQPSS